MAAIAKNRHKPSQSAASFTSPLSLPKLPRFTVSSPRHLSHSTCVVSPVIVRSSTKCSNYNLRRTLRSCLQIPLMSTSAFGDPVKLHHVPQNFDSLDARVVQYKYAIVKLQRLIKSIDGALELASGSTHGIVLVQYIIHLSATVFAINESGFAPMLAALETFKHVKPSNISISQVVTHVAYDMKDHQVIPLETLPSKTVAVNCLKSFKAICVNCLDGYQKRYANALREIKNSEYMDDLDVLFNKSFFDPDLDIDLTLNCSKISPSFVLPLELNKDALEDPDFDEASLIDMDIYALFTLTLQMSQMLARARPQIARYRDLKLTQRNLQESAFKAIPQHEYSFHRILFWALRLNDLYSIIRRFGRQIFLGNLEHLQDSKFVSQMHNGAFFKTSVLKEIDEFFNTSKKNGILIATITRFIRMNSKYEVKVSNVLEFVGFIQQGFSYIETLNKKFQDFGMNWIAGELSFRRLHELPLSILDKLNTTLQEEVAKDLRLKKELALQNERNKAKHITKPAAKPSRPTATSGSAKSSSPVQSSRSSTASPNVSKSASPVPPQAPSQSSPASKPVQKTISTPKPSKLVITRSARSSSVSSINSPNGNSPKKEVPASDPPNRPLSMIFLNSNSSASSVNSLQTQPLSPIDKNKIVNTTTGGRRRSSSQPLSFNASAAALKQASSKDAGLRSPTGSIRRVPSTSMRPTNSLPQSPLAAKANQLNVVNEVEPEPPKLSASQKFQLHLKEASKSGALNTQERETLTNVLFDPNNPSAIKLRRYAEPPKAQPAPVVEEKPRPNAQEVAESSARASLKKAHGLRPTVAQVTKINTQRNSVLLQLPDSTTQSRSGESLLSDVSVGSSASTPTAVSSSAGDDTSMSKKVRFTGVPEYTPAEDAPTKPSTRILKNFANFKVPLINRGAHAAFKKKDELLKKEESTLFRQQLHPGTNTIQASVQQPGSYVPVTSPQRLSGFRS